MFEHVGVNHFRTFFKTCRDLMTPDGVMLLHSIGRSGPPGDTGAWIQRYIFPGRLYPGLVGGRPACRTERAFPHRHRDPAPPLRQDPQAWRERFLAHREEVAALYDERFCRMWEFYLAASEVSFRVGGLVNFQIQLTKNLETLPLTRDYMGEAEKALRRAEGEAARRTPLKLAGE